jgi:hypothetical protein
MLRVAPKVLLTMVVLLGAGAALPGPQGFIPPPPEFPEVSTLAGAIDAPTHKWAPAMGAPTSLLDILPPGGPAVGDFNRDGYPDVFLPQGRYTDAALQALRAPRSSLHLNHGSGITVDNFLDVTDVAGLGIEGWAYTASWADVDNDGDLDLFVGGYRMARLFLHDGLGRFTEATQAMGLPQGGFVLGGAWGDADRDGDLDLYLVQFASYQHPEDGLPDLHDLPGLQDVLLRNDGAAFTDITTSAGIAGAKRGTSAAWVDADRDGLLDVYVTNYGQDADLWRNRGDGTFEAAAQALGIEDGEDATCQAWADLDRDGRLDLFVAHQDGTPDGVWLARPDGTFQEISGTLGLQAQSAGDGWGCAAFDYDNDGDIDLLTLHGGLRGERQRSTLMRNALDDLGFQFEDVTAEAGDRDVEDFQHLDTLANPLALGGSALADWSLAAAPSVLTAGNPPAGAPEVHAEHLRMFKNLGWISWVGNGDAVKASLRGTSSPRDGHGAVVTIQAGNISVTHQVGAAMAWGGTSHGEVQAGLWKADEGGYRGEQRPTSVTIRWPSGHVDHHPNVWGARKWVHFTEGQGWQNDTLAPRPILTLLAGTPGEHGWFRSDVTLKVTAQDLSKAGSEARGARTLRYSLDGTTWTTAPSPSAGAVLTFTGEGTHRLWVEATDKAGDVPGWTDNKAVTLFPIRIDATPPQGQVRSPLAGGVYAQGRELALVPGLDRALVLAPAPLALAEGGGEVGVLLGSHADSPGKQPIRAEATDATSGVHRVLLRLERPDGLPVANGSATLRLAPYAWHWATGDAAAGEYVLTATLVDHAGNTATLSQRVVLLPSGQAGLVTTAQQGPSVPRLL